MYLFSNIIGVFVFDGQFNVIDEISFKSLEDYKNKEQFIKELKNKYKNLKEPEQEVLKSILLYFKNKKFFSNFYNKNLQLTKQDIKNSVSSDVLIVQAIKSIEEIDKSISLLVKRLREWYGFYNPEFTVSMGDNEKFIYEILEKEKAELLEKLKVNINESIGAELNQEDIEPVKSLARQMHNLYKLRKSQDEYVSAMMDGLCPNMKAVCESVLGAKLIEHAGSLKKLSEMPASTIQILGAESALFRHMRTGAKPPRHGIIANHPLIAKAPDKMHGKIARALADKIAIAVKVDYFQGKFIGDKLREGLEKKFNQNDKNCIF